MAIVAIKSQQVTLYDAEGWIMRAPVSTGVKERETPAGVFAIVEKNKDHRSNMYDDASMPNMQRITWNGLALHGGPLPGYAASHGCVRMPFGFAEKLFDKTRIGMRVIISPDDTAPVDFSHPALSLFVPNTEVIAAAPAKAETLAREAAEAAKTADEAKKTGAVAARETAPLAASLRKLERLKARTEADLAFADRALATAKTNQARAKARTVNKRPRPRQQSWALSSDTTKAEREIKARRCRRCKRSGQDRSTKNADTANGGARREARARAGLGLHQPRDADVYVRRNTQKPAPDGGGEVFDATIEVPVTIRDPGRPLGTHVFTAVARNDTGLRWTAVTIENGDDAKNALDRITIPKEVLDRIAPTALPRSSIVVSDEPLSEETNYRTEFVAVLSDQPQGGLHHPQAERSSHGGRQRLRQPTGRRRLRPLLPRNPNPQPSNTRRGGGQYYPPVQRGWW